MPRVGDIEPDVGDMPTPSPDDYTDLDRTSAASIESMEEGGRIEPKWYTNRNGTKRLYYVRRFERKHEDGRRYRPMHYIGTTPPGAIAIGDVPHAVPHVSSDVPHASKWDPHASQAREEPCGLIDP